MSNDPEGEPRWLQPPAPGEVRIHISVGQGAELTPEVRQAIHDLGRALEEQEVQGYEKPQPCTGFIYCPDRLWCKPSYGSTCSPQVDMPCRHLHSCTGQGGSR